MTGSAATVDRLVADLARLGITPGDVVMVHASLRAVGPVQGNVAGLIAALDRAVTPDGTLLMVLGAHDAWSWVNRLPEAQRPAALAHAEPFDALHTPADPDVGMLAEVFRRSPGTLVSDHPEGRLAARGHRAAQLVADPPWDDYYGPGSALERLVELGGRIVRLGADLDTVTLLHYAEYLAAVPNKRRTRRHRVVATPDGPQIRVIDCLDDSLGIVDHPGEDYFATILRSYLARGRAHSGTVGRAGSELIEAHDIVQFGAQWMETHLGAEHPD